MQCLRASGACHIGALFLQRHYEPWLEACSRPRVVFIPQESWPNHHGVFRHLGLETAPLPWYNLETHSVDMHKLLAGIDSLPPRSVVILQTAGQNPTGCDPSALEWQRLALSLFRGGHLAFLDSAYPGFGPGDVKADYAPIRLRRDWEIDVRHIADELKGRWKRLFHELDQLQTPGD
ncbi:PLP-dependent transferase [Colletotrichum eremochloae]|nr:PLP-dependent transferase [Colletotrichum eremochloae]